MKLNELRIGNVVSINKNALKLNENAGPHNAKIYSISPTSVELSIGELLAEVQVDEISSITLSNELIKNMGFIEHYNSIKTYYNPYMEIDHDFKLMKVDFELKIKYVHQLQNLYFDITGKELEVNL